jgi:hypothetical protein
MSTILGYRISDLQSPFHHRQDNRGLWKPVGDFLLAPIIANIFIFLQLSG